MHVWSHDTPAAAETTSDNPEGVYNEIDEKQIYLVPQREVHNGGRQNSEQGANPYASLKSWDIRTTTPDLCHGNVISRKGIDEMVNSIV